MATVKYNETISLLRSIQRELNHVYKKPTKSKVSHQTQSPSWRYMMNIMRENQVTDKRFCRPQDHYKYFANTYLTYLNSSRMEDELVKKYFNKGERSIKDSARLVGLELPKLTNQP